MHVSVTTLGASAGEEGRAADQIVGYLQGQQQTRGAGSANRRSRPGSLGADASQIASALARPDGPGGYYADSAEVPGRWRGSGSGPDGHDLGGIVEPEAFRRVLLGQDPNTGHELISLRTSTGGQQATTSPTGERLTPREAAGELGVSQSYVQRLVKRTAEIRSQQAAASAAGGLAPELPSTYLDAVNENGRWYIDRAELDRFADGRKEAQVVMGYDITWSAPKSVSMLYARGDDELRDRIDNAIESAVSAGMAYLEAEGFHVRAGRGRERAGDMLAASYRHTTNRALEPQLHEHVVVANMATSATGVVRAVDARGLFAHATPAGYLAGAQLRHELRQAGIGWGEVHKGLADVAGVERDEIMAMSSRRSDVLSLSEELGYFTAQARQTAALASRPGKETSVDRQELFDRWRDMLDSIGFDEARVARLTSHDPAPLWRVEDTEQLYAHLSSHRGVTEQSAIFDRRDVIKAIAEYSVDRLGAAEISDLADHWLSTDAVVALEINDGARRETIGTGTAQVSLAPDEQRYSTPEMLALEKRTVELHRNGIRTGKALVDPAVVEHAITTSTKTRGFDLGADQADMVRAITTSGDQFQAVQGLAGAGKTTAIAAAVDAWNNAGYDVIGAAPFAEAARKLEADTGLRSATLEGLLHRIELAGDPRSVLSPHTVVIVDEASTIGSRQLHRLYRAAAETGASVRTIGDPQQHQSVEAGGLWQHITTEFADRTPVLSRNRRQSGETMAEVRLALDEYHNGLIATALGRLDDDNRIVIAESWDDLLDQMTADWYLDHQRHRDGLAEPSKMIAERNSDRHALNRRAQHWLRSDGSLSEGVDIGDDTFHVGDRVVAQRAGKDLRADNAGRREHVINGSQGTVTAITGPTNAPDLVVDFDGLGTIRVPHDFTTTEVGPGRGGGLTPAYAVTSYKAEGQTYDTGRSLAAPGAINTEGMYVALTRGRHDLRVYSIAPADQRLEPPELPIIDDPRAATQALADTLSKWRGATVASAADPAAAAVASIARSQLSDLDTRTDGAGRRALQAAQHRIGAHAIHTPDPQVVALVGPRPEPGSHRKVWDDAVAQLAIYRSRWGAAPEARGLAATPAPDSSASAAQVNAHTALTTAVEHAKARRLETLPLHAVLTERSGNVAALNALSSDGGPALAEVATAMKEQRSQQRRVTATEARLRALSIGGPSRRIIDPDRVETSRRALADAKVALARADAALAYAWLRLDATRGHQPARDTLRTRIETIDHALDHRIIIAVKQPAGYLTATLGPKPPKHHTHRKTWNAAASEVETYRHKILGLDPGAGPLPGNGIRSAIGPRPRVASTQRAWTRAHDAVARYGRDPLQQERTRVRRIT
jgi:conjugative relaxase-like TrwC/TraI family protein